MGEGYPDINNRDTDALSKAEIQRELEAKRNKIANTVDEIRSTLSDEVRERRQAMREAFDWHTYVDKNPAACIAGAAVVGFFVGKIVGDRMFEHEPEPTWRDRTRDRADAMRDRAETWRDRARDQTERSYRGAERKLDEWRGRAQGESKWKARTRSAMSSGTNIATRELIKTAQRMILPTIIAAITGKAASDNKTTVVEKEVHRTPGPAPDVERTTDVTEIKDGEVKTDRDDPMTI